ncbi:class I SAM-dependent methyltransferase [Methanoregula sp. UBA64]|jgi:SAM-dependent methyltransferase|uniref:class I SAM-dependent methyltransferase n=1 Tax=Methanoregula sp. UBA64 TaxID=1915554 RepID=UPI0025FE9DEF|nr:class I SAM-dependent methyltransferase [Methanoregula sp. UBA64]
MMLDVSDIDWNEAWKHEASAPGKTGSFVSCIDRWSDPARCRKFSCTAKEGNWKGSRARIGAMNLTPDSRVLDIGAGPGTLAVPLAKIVRHVTAVEPAPGMVACLEENCREESIENIRIVPKKWEDMDISADPDAPYDVVVASYSLGVPDLREALRKMNTASSKYVYIFWFADMQSPWRRNYHEIWEPLFGECARKKGRPNIIVNLLNQMGIYASVEVTKEEQMTGFASLDEAVADQAGGLKLKSEEQVAVLRTYLEKKLLYENGRYVLKGPSYQAKIWWEKED